MQHFGAIDKLPKQQCHLSSISKVHHMRRGVVSGNLLKSEKQFKPDVEFGKKCPRKKNDHSFFGLYLPHQ